MKHNGWKEGRNERTKERKEGINGRRRRERQKGLEGS